MKDRLTQHHHPQYDDDRMSALPDVDADIVTPKKKRGRQHEKMQRRVIELEMPSCEPTQHPDSKARKTVRMLCVNTIQT